MNNVKLQDNTCVMVQYEKWAFINDSMYLVKPFLVCWHSYLGTWSNRIRFYSLLYLKLAESGGGVCAFLMQGVVLLKWVNLYQQFVGAARLCNSGVAAGQKLIQSWKDRVLPGTAVRLGSMTHEASSSCVSLSWVDIGASEKVIWIQLHHKYWVNFLIILWSQ